MDVLLPIEFSAPVKSLIIQNRIQENRKKEKQQANTEKKKAEEVHIFGLAGWLRRKFKRHVGKRIVS